MAKSDTNRDKLGLTNTVTKEYSLKLLSLEGQTWCSTKSSSVSTKRSRSPAMYKDLESMGAKRLTSQFNFLQRDPHDKRYDGK